MQTNHQGPREENVKAPTPDPRSDRWGSLVTGILDLRLGIHLWQFHVPLQPPPSVPYAPDLQIVQHGADAQKIDSPHMLKQEKAMGDLALSVLLPQGDEVAASAAKTPDAKQTGAPPRLQTLRARR